MGSGDDSRIGTGVVGVDDEVFMMKVGAEDIEVNIGRRRPGGGAAAGHGVIDAVVTRNAAAVEDAANGQTRNGGKLAAHGVQDGVLGEGEDAEIEAVVGALDGADDAALGVVGGAHVLLDPAPADIEAVGSVVGFPRSEAGEQGIGQLRLAAPHLVEFDGIGRTQALVLDEEHILAIFGRAGERGIA